MRLAGCTDRSVGADTACPAAPPVVRFALRLARIALPCASIDVAELTVGQFAPPRTCCGLRPTISDRHTWVVHRQVATFADRLVAGFPARSHRAALARRRDVVHPL